MSSDHYITNNFVLQRYNSLIIGLQYGWEFPKVMTFNKHVTLNIFHICLNNIYWQISIFICWVQCSTPSTQILGCGVKSWARFFTLDCCMNEYLLGGYLYKQPLHINRSIAWSFPEKLRRCLIEQVCQGVKHKALCTVLKTGYCTT